MSDPLPVVDLDAERAVLGACMLDTSGAALDEVRPICRHYHFSLPLHREVYETLERLADRAEPLDVVTIAHDLRGRNKWGPINSTHLLELIEGTPAIANVPAHARIVRDLYRARRAATEASRIALEATQLRGADSESVATFLANTEETFAALAQDAAVGNMRIVREVLQDVSNTLQKICQNQTRVTGVPLGFDKLDEMLTGLQEGDLAILAARPGMGKTAFALSGAIHTAKQGYGVVFFSLEMPAEQLALRLVAIQSGVDLQRLRSGDLAPLDWTLVTKAMSDLAALPIFIDDTPAVGLTDIRSGLRRLQRETAMGKHPEVTQRLGLIVVDYLQLVTPLHRSGSREQDISELSRNFKRLAKEHKIAILLVAQLNREPEKRPDHRPRLSDLRESGSIEQDADIVIFVHRPEYYAKERKRKGDEEDTSEVAPRGQAEIIVAKQRNGPTGIVWAVYRATTTEFRNYKYEGQEFNEYDDFPGKNEDLAEERYS